MILLSTTTSTSIISKLLLLVMWFAFANAVSINGVDYDDKATKELLRLYQKAAAERIPGHKFVSWEEESEFKLQAFCAKCYSRTDFEFAAQSDPGWAPFLKDFSKENYVIISVGFKNSLVLTVRGGGDTEKLEIGESFGADETDKSKITRFVESLVSKLQTIFASSESKVYVFWSGVVGYPFTTGTMKYQIKIGDQNIPSDFINLAKSGTGGWTKTNPVFKGAAEMAQKLVAAWQGLDGSVKDRFISVIKRRSLEPKILGGWVRKMMEKDTSSKFLLYMSGDSIDSYERQEGGIAEEKAPVDIDIKFLDILKATTSLTKTQKVEWNVFYGPRPTFKGGHLGTDAELAEKQKAEVMKKATKMIESILGGLTFEDWDGISPFDRVYQTGLMRSLYYLLNPGGTGSLAARFVDYDDEDETGYASDDSYHKFEGHGRGDRLDRLIEKYRYLRALNRMENKRHRSRSYH